MQLSLLGFPVLSRSAALHLRRFGPGRTDRSLRKGNLSLQLAKIRYDLLLAHYALNDQIPSFFMRTRMALGLRPK